MRILVTGGLGFIGSSVVLDGLARGSYILNVDSQTYAANPDNVRDAISNAKYSHACVDLLDYASLLKLFFDWRPDCVMHLAAESHVDNSIINPGIFLQTNIIGTYNLLMASRAYLDEFGLKDFRFLHVSTDEVFGSLELSGTSRFDEKTPYNPRSPYSASKASSDFLVRAWGETYDFPYLITNCSNNFGPRQHLEKFIPKCIINGFRGDFVPVYGKGINVRDWLYVEDHVDGLFSVLHFGKLGHSYNIGGFGEKTNLEVVREVLDCLSVRLGRDLTGLIRFVPDRPGHDLRYAIDPSFIQSDLGWYPKYSFGEGLNHTIDWYFSEYF